MSERRTGPVHASAVSRLLALESERLREAMLDRVEDGEMPGESDGTLSA